MLGRLNEMDLITIETIIVAVAAFWLGACPFAVWIGRLALHRDPRNYGDHNPGTVNVFRAGSVFWGIITLVVEMGKGFILVALTNLVLKLPLAMLMVIALCAILGHAFSPLLKFRGGKALAVTGGTLLAISPLQIFLSIILLLAFFYLFVKEDSWTVIMAVICCFILFLLTRGPGLEALFIFCILLILTVKHFEDLKNHPNITIKPLRWLHIHHQS
jgi:acyl phosphate:glycerol-3-phosphate acyltransferase